MTTETGVSNAMHNLQTYNNNY